MKMRTKQTILTRLLPKTDQTSVYVAGDDATYQVGWWKGLTVAANKTRFIAKTLDGDDVVLDLATGLMWAADGNEAGANNSSIATWPNALAYAGLLDFAGFTDWRVPNIKELVSIVNYENVSPAVDVGYFIHIASADYWSSTTVKAVATNALTIQFAIGLMYNQLKTGLYRLLCVRGGV